ncbi:MAG: polysaccharide deacetylase family protein [Planctomycetota bacterium]|nr:polysaccharide deacetylase family protein [Planctomycetota bacterium]
MQTAPSMVGLFAVASLAAWMLSLPGPARAADAAAPGATRIAQWKDDKKAAFLLMFDDNMPSHVKNVIPELKKRNFTGTFYVNPGKKPFWTAVWEKDIPAAGVVLANHTMHHTGAKDLAGLEEEIKLCSEAINKVTPNCKEPRLLSFGTPGVNKDMWQFSKEQINALLAKYNLIDRGPFLGAVIHYKTGKEMAAVVDKAIAAGSAGYIVFHGVGGEWISIPLPDFIELLDHLVATQDQVWVTDHSSAHKYATERAGAEARVVEANDKQIKLSLTSKADAQLYDLPLTLVTQVPAGWQKCQVVQGTKKTVVTATNGAVKFEALPGAEPITLQPE